jgi:hypothetical protein
MLYNDWIDWSDKLETRYEQENINNLDIFPLFCYQYGHFKLLQLTDFMKKSPFEKLIIT